MKWRPLTREFYNRPTLSVARDLLGQLLVRRWDNQNLVGRIVETEAYIGENDPACHAARGLTPRNAIMYGPPGHAYIYFIYGMYYCLNVVTEREGFPAAVLIRAVEPLEGISFMKTFRGVEKLNQLASGPGKLCQAFQLDRSLNGKDLCRVGDLFIAAGTPIPDDRIVQTSRVGIREGQHHLWRFYIQNNAHVSKPNSKPDQRRSANNGMM